MSQLDYDKGKIFLLLSNFEITNLNNSYDIGVFRYKETVMLSSSHYNNINYTLERERERERERILGLSAFCMHI